MPPEARTPTAAGRNVAGASDVARWGALVERIARKLSRHTPASVTERDLAGYGWVGLMEALNRAPAGMPADELEAYCAVRVRGAMLDHLRALDPMSRDARRASRRLAEAIRRLTARLGTAPDEAAIAAELGVTVTTYRRTLDTLALAGMARLTPLNVDAVEVEVGDGPEDIVVDRQRRGLLAVAIERLPERQRQVLALQYTDGCTLREIGAILGVTESRVCQIHAEAIHRLRAALGTA